MKLKNKKVQITIGILISAVFLYLAAKDVDFKAFWGYLKNVNLPVYFSSITITILAFWFRAVRWRILLKPAGDFKTKDLFGSIMIGFMANNIFPARAGEFLRAYSSSRKLKINSVTSFGTIILERVFDGVILFAFLLYSIFAFPFPDVIKKGGYIIGPVYLGILVMIFFFQKDPEKTAAIIKKIFFFLPQTLLEKLDHLLKSFITGFHILKNFKETLSILFQSIIVWLLSAAIIHVVLIAMGFFKAHPELHWSVSIVIISITAVGAMIPAAPGYIGTSQYFTIVALKVFGISESESLAFSLVHFISQYIPINILGFYYFYKEHISLKDSEKLEEKIENEQ